MAKLRRILEIAANLFSGGLCLAMVGIALVGKLAGGSFQIEMLPWWSGDQLKNILLFGGIFGLAVTVLAASGKFKWGLPVWTLAVLGAMAGGYLFSNYKYEGYDEFRQSINLIAAQFAAFGASVSQALNKRA